MDNEDYPATAKKTGKQHNNLPLWGNEASMNLNPLILANIQGSSYFKVHLFKLKTYHEVVDEIYYQVKHLEPWERGSRKTSGQTGMCGGVRGVGAGGIVSTAFCLLYKLYTLRLTRKQVNGLLNHTDSPYIRGLGFMYLRYTQPPGDLYDWYEDYLEDEEEIDCKAGGGQSTTIGQMAYQLLTKLDWFSTLFPRIPVPIQKQIEKKIEEYSRVHKVNFNQGNNNKVNNYAREAHGSNYSRGGNGGEQFDDRDKPTTVYQDRERGGEFGRDYNDFKRRDEQRECRERSDYAPKVSSYRDDHDHRRSNDERYERTRSDSRDRHERREKHKKKHKHRDRSRSREKRKDRHSSRDRHKEKEQRADEYERRYR